MNLVSQKMGMSEWSYHNDYNPSPRQKMSHVELTKRFESLDLEVELGFSVEQTVREVQRCLNCDVETAFNASACIECDACIDICPGAVPDDHEQRPRGRPPYAPLGAGASTSTRRSTSPRPLPQTGRVMVKDENVCVHCGLCAERCPTAAWDMEQFDLQIPYAASANFIRNGAMSPSGAGDRSEELTMAIDTRLDHRVQVNDFSIKLANVNGTGSASANSLLMQAIFRMGIPVSGKNLFPSNIQGLPTWYEIRVNETGYTARALDYDLVVAMNAQTYAQDINDVRHGGYVVYDSSWPLDPDLTRDDVTFLGVPLAKMCLENFKAPRERILMKNIAYAGAIVAMVGIDVDLVADLLAETFARNEALNESNQRALRLGYDYAIENFACPLPFYVEPMDANGTSILINGNMATALGCLYAGATVAGWYPITPATAVMDNFIALCARYRRETVASDDPEVPESKRNNYLIIQAEDEIAAIGMVLGASWSGARAFTSTSGPGHLAHERAARARVLHRDPGRHHRRAAHRPVDGHAHSYPAGRHLAVRLR